MAQQTINIGTVANDDTGDTLRDGGDKINQNFTELYGAMVTIDNDTTLAGDSATAVPSQHAVKTAIANAVAGLLDLRGGTDCSAEPNYPAASKGDAYVVTVAGKIGGAAGASVSVGDVYFASADNAGGTQAAVGASWDVIVHSSGSAAGALLAVNDLADLDDPATARANLDVYSTEEVDAAIAAGGGGGGVSSRTWTGAPGYISSGSLAMVGADTSINVPYPTGILAGDAVILEVHALALSGRTINTPAGFTYVWDGQIGGAGQASGWDVWVFIKTNLAGSEQGPVSVTASATSGGNALIRGVMHLIAGVKKSGTAFEGAGNAGSAGATANSPSVTTTGANRLVCNIVGTDKTNGVPEVSPPIGYTQFWHTRTSYGYGSSEIFNCKVQAAAATVAISATTLSTGPYYGVVSFALIPETP